LFKSKICGNFLQNSLKIFWNIFSGCLFLDQTKVLFSHKHQESFFWNESKIINWIRN
jgi:hypothetical protein